LSFGLFGILANAEFKCVFQGDLHQYLKEKGALAPATAVNFALDIARYCQLSRADVLLAL
jgi:hypothetical protein